MNSTTTSDSAYGFTIGEDKKLTYAKAQKILPSMSKSGVFIEVIVDSEIADRVATGAGHTILSQTLLHDVGYANFQRKDRWEFYFGASYFDKLSLTFCNERLCEIHRHRKNFELP